MKQAKKPTTYKGVVIDDEILQMAFVGYGLRRDFIENAMDQIYHAITGTTHPTTKAPAKTQPSAKVVSIKKSGWTPEARAKLSKSVRASWRKRKKAKANAA